MAEYVDIISRQSAIDELNKLNISDGVGISSIALDLQEEAIRSIKTLPSAESERKTGRWLDGNRIGYGLTLHWYIYCSECLWERDDDNHDKDTPYCPICGAKMEGSDETD